MGLRARAATQELAQPEQAVVNGLRRVDFELPTHKLALRIRHTKAWAQPDMRLSPRNCRINLQAPGKASEQEERTWLLRMQICCKSSVDHVACMARRAVRVTVHSWTAVLAGNQKDTRFTLSISSRYPTPATAPQDTATPGSPARRRDSHSISHTMLPHP